MEDMAGGELRNEGGGVLRGGEFSAKISRRHKCTYRSMRRAAGRGGNVSCVLVAATHRSESAFRWLCSGSEPQWRVEVTSQHPIKTESNGANSLYRQRGPKASIRAP
jgi:hypothetical protein